MGRGFSAKIPADEAELAECRRQVWKAIEALKDPSRIMPETGAIQPMSPEYLAWKQARMDRIEAQRRES